MIFIMIECLQFILRVLLGFIRNHMRMHFKIIREYIFPHSNIFCLLVL